jgi:hypothetical protein
MVRQQRSLAVDRKMQRKLTVAVVSRIYRVFQQQAVLQKLVRNKKSEVVEF